ncbi:MAG: Gfo/Idh/MocA family oxidoreductase [Proteobacteria bacterium]|nr:Gfo/Idh/MocA family oxidoreductase [Pseudomonadota bacterium]
MRIGLVGAGAIAQAHLEAVRQVDSLTLAGIADVRLDAAHAMAEEADCPAFESAEALAEETDCDAVIVCTPPASHADICHALLDRRLSILCEKPLCLDSATAEALLEKAKSANVVFTMASKFRYVDDVVRARSMVESGVVGDLVLFENAFTAHVDMSKRWNADPQLSGGGVLIDNGTHSVDIARYFLGPVAEVQAVEGKRIQGLAVEDTARLFLRSRDGVMATIDLSWSLNKELDHFIDIYGSAGALRVGWRESRYRQTASSDWVTFGTGYQKVAAFANQLRNFEAAVRGDQALRITADDALASVRVMEAAYRSLGSNNWEVVEAGRG